MIPRSVFLPGNIGHRTMNRIGELGNVKDDVCKMKSARHSVLVMDCQSLCSDMGGMKQEAVIV
jgi:hypothetical protein